MKRKFRMIVGMLLLAIPLCMNAQVKPVKPNQQEKEGAKPVNVEKPEKKDEPKGGVTMPKISGFVQGMYQANLSDKGDLLDNTLRMRRVRLSVEHLDGVCQYLRPQQEPWPLQGGSGWTAAIR